MAVVPPDPAWGSFGSVLGSQNLLRDCPNNLLRLWALQVLGLALSN